MKKKKRKKKKTLQKTSLSQSRLILKDKLFISNSTETALIKKDLRNMLDKIFSIEIEHNTRRVDKVLGV